VSHKPRSRYIIFQCPSCQSYQVAETRHASKTCSRCGVNSKLHTVQVKGRSDNAQHSVEVIQMLKAGLDPLIEFKQYREKD